MAVVFAFDGLVLYFGGIKSLAYLLLGNVFGGGIHPMAGHLIAEHYTFAKVRSLVGKSVEAPVLFKAFLAGSFGCYHINQRSCLLRFLAVMIASAWVLGLLQDKQSQGAESSEALSSVLIHSSTR